MYMQYNIKIRTLGWFLKQPTDVKENQNNCNYFEKNNEYTRKSIASGKRSLQIKVILKKRIISKLRWELMSFHDKVNTSSFVVVFFSEISLFGGLCAAMIYAIRIYNSRLTM